MSELITTSVIPTSSGFVQGFVNPMHDIHTFLGIPYAYPPVGDLRFRPPVPFVDSSEEIKICMEHAPAAPQTQMPFDTLMSVEIDNQSEDCLYLNIWAPDTEPDSKRPVLIWFHPGACMSGSSSQVFWDGTNLARNDIIVVSFNYRLGALGWTRLDHLSSDFEGSGNLGLLDQIEAVKWVKENIASFGGDPDNLTAYGASAGATTIMAAILSPTAAGLFRRVVLQSPPMFMANPSDWAATKGSLMLHSLGVPKDDVGEMRDVDVQSFLEAQTFMTTWPNFLEGLAPIGPSVDGTVLPTTLMEHFLHKALPKGYENLEIMIGFTRDEFNFFFPFLPNFQDMDDSMFVRTYFSHIFGHKNARRAYEIYRDQIVPPSSPPSEVARYMASDVMCRVSTLLTAENLARHGHKVWLYEWDYESNDVENIIKAAHMVDAIYSWDNLEYWVDNPFLGPGDDVERDQIAKQMSRAIVSFARSGDPDHPGIPHWPAYCQPGKETERDGMVFDQEVRVERNIYDHGLALWKTQLKEYVRNQLCPIKAKEETASLSSTTDDAAKDVSEPEGSSGKKRKIDAV